MLDRVQIKLEAKGVVRSAKVSAYLFTLLALALAFLLNGVSDYMSMDDVWAYDYSVRTGFDLSFLALHGAYPTILVLFVSVVTTLTGLILDAGQVLYHLGVRRGEEMPYTALFEPGHGCDGSSEHEQGPDDGLQGAAVRAGPDVHRLVSAQRTDGGHPTDLARALPDADGDGLFPADQEHQGHRVLPRAAPAGK